MPKRPPLATAKVKPDTAAALRALAESVPAAPIPDASDPSPPPAEVSAKSAVGAPKTFRAATREGLKKVTVGLSPEQHEELKVMAARRRATVEELLREAITDLFGKHASSR